ncbi:4'-phosphopantetheinyl transferase family protein [Microscilla marina]|uniref:4'-phosphopantetheinyl transferase gsp, putative n=1 Tax=Microscilla marina ATCC 23134 TaxID=313606 RepID=A1ZLW2_MICM2|nr:4'-phosphopantetheinyl transferase superfamily protein [Microscilla marina]EAY28494.1 4'-phosphopantetheinyl transferase gsp, putative [Microscilla marina ATCC 23134]
MKPYIHIHYAYVPQVKAHFSLEDLLQQLPKNLHEGIMRYVFDKDRYVHALGKYLLQQQLIFFGIPPERLSQLTKTTYGKPVLPGKPFYFNISHSHELVACGATLDGKLGLDVEHQRSITMNDFESYFTKPEWQKIKEDDTLHTFFEIWTKKESVMKADGRGMYLSLDTIDTLQNPVRLTDASKTCWFLQELHLGTAYKACLCTIEPAREVVLKKMI